MIRWWSRAPIRVRLTAWYTAVLTLMLIVYATATFVAVRHEFYEQLEQAEAGHNGEVPVEAQLREILLVLVFGLPPIVALAGIGGYILAQRALAPIDRLASETHRVTADRLHERVSVPNPNDEIGRLGAIINETLARLEASFDQLKRFTADASHELRTPLSVIRGIGEVGLRETRTPAEYKEAIGSMLEEVDRLTRLVDTLLRLARGDAGTIRFSRERVDLGVLTRDVVSSLAVLAEERHQDVRVSVPDDVHVFADRLVLREGLTNVIDNAIKYGPPSSRIDVGVRTENGGAVLTVADQGPGIPPEHRGRVFDRFYRIDEGRSRDRGGTGLGLAIAKWAVEANDGSIAIDGDNTGTILRIALPITATKDHSS